MRTYAILGRCTDWSESLLVAGLIVGSSGAGSNDIFYFSIFTQNRCRLRPDHRAQNALFSKYGECQHCKRILLRRNGGPYNHTTRYSRLSLSRTQGTLWNTSRYPYFDISDLQNWGKQLTEQLPLTEWICNLTPKLEIYWKYCGKEEKLLLRSNFSSFPQCFVACW